MYTDVRTVASPPRQDDGQGHRHHHHHHHPDYSHHLPHHHHHCHHHCHHHHRNNQFSSVQSLSRVRLFAASWTAACRSSLSITNSQNLLKLMSMESVMPSHHLILCFPLLLPPSIFPSIRVFSNESVLCIRWPKYWSFSFSISLSNENSGLISFRMDWLDLLAVQGTLKSLLQHHSSKATNQMQLLAVNIHCTPEKRQPRRSGDLPSLGDGETGPVCPAASSSPLPSLQALHHWHLEEEPPGGEPPPH